MTALEQALRTALLHFVWQGVVVAFLLWVALFLMRKRSANARYFVSCLALIALVALPVVTACVVYSQPSLPTSSARLAETFAETAAGVWARSSPASVTWLESFEKWALPLWSLGVVLFALRLAWGSKQVALLRRSGQPADGPVFQMAAALGSRMGLTRPVRLLISSLAEGPSVVGWIRPVILLPSATLLGLTPEQLEAVLAHEFAHIRRYDYLVNVLQMVVESLLFYHPAVWWTSARIRHERELCCDDLAVSSCGDALCYARALTRLERLRVLAPKMAMGSTDGPLLYRIQRLTGAATRRFGPSKLPGIFAICLGVVCIALNLNWVRGHAQVVHAQKAAAAPVQAITDAPGVRVDLGGARVIDRVPVEYPTLAIDDEIDGNVEVEATLDGSGKVRDARVLSGPDELRDAVLASVRKWNFKPDPANGTLRFVVEFQLPSVDSDSTSDDDNDVEIDSGDDCDSDMEVSEPENVMTGLEEQLQEAETALEEAESELNEKGADLAAQLEEAQRELEKLGNLEVLHNLVDGRTLKRIRILDLSEAARIELTKRLPVREGDKLSQSVLEKLEKAVREFDSHCYVLTVPVEDTDATVLIKRK